MTTDRLTSAHWRLAYQVIGREVAHWRLAYQIIGREVARLLASIEQYDHLDDRGVIESLPADEKTRVLVVRDQVEQLRAVYRRLFDRVNP